MGRWRKLLHKIKMFRNKRFNDMIEWWTWDRYKRIRKDIETWTWKRYKQGEDKWLYTFYLWDYLADLQYKQNKVLYHQGEKVRIVFLYQVASFWTSWEILYEEMIQDERFDIRLVCLDETAKEKFQMQTAKTFLNDKNIPYLLFEDFEIEEFNPHIVLMQTPYDAGHRKKEHWSAIFKSKGYRIAYIPYGVEISDTEDSHFMHFSQHVVVNAWRIYTFSKLMQRDYRKYCQNREAVKALGLPRFDALYHKEKFILDHELQEKIAGRKIILWKAHFPKIIYENDQKIFVTPDVNDYIKFAEEINNYADKYFFIFMPHPRFLAPTKDMNLQELAETLIKTLEEKENVYIDTKDDYRFSLINADYIIIDRSAIMVEAAMVQVPILFMYNPNYYEPVTNAIKELIDSYYQGSCYDDMVSYMEMITKDEDPKKQEREQAFEHCIPCFDGKCSERIREDIIESLRKEGEEQQGELVILKEQIEEIIDKKLEENTEKILEAIKKEIGDKK